MSATSLPSATYIFGELKVCIQKGILVLNSLNLCGQAAATTQMFRGRLLHNIYVVLYTSVNSPFPLKEGMVEERTAYYAM